jgi:hypothetical protein
VTIHLAMGDGFGLSGVANNADLATATRDGATSFAAPSIARRYPLVIGSRPYSPILEGVSIAWV